MDPKPARHIRVVPDPEFDAEPFLAEIERRDQIIKDLQYELNRAMEREAAHKEVAAAAGRSLVATKGQKARVARKAATAEQVTAVVDCWLEHRPKCKREESFPVGGKRWEMIEKALELMAHAEGGPVQALKEAIEGLHLCPYLVYGKRAVAGKKSDLRVRPEDCFRDEIWLERARSAYEWAQALPSERRRAMYDLTSAFSDSWFRCWVNASYGTESGRDA